MRKSLKKNIEQKINEFSTVHRGWRSKDISDGMCRNANLTAPLQKKRPRCHTRRNTPKDDENTDDTIVMPWWLWLNAGQDNTEMHPEHHVRQLPGLLDINSEWWILTAHLNRSAWFPLTFPLKWFEFCECLRMMIHAYNGVVIVRIDRNRYVFADATHESNSGRSRMGRTVQAERRARQHRISGRMRRGLDTWEAHEVLGNAQDAISGYLRSESGGNSARRQRRTGQDEEEAPRRFKTTWKSSQFWKTF